MLKDLKQKLIIITGSPCVGKTAVAERLFESYENSAYFDGYCEQTISDRYINI